MAQQVFAQCPESTRSNTIFAKVETCKEHKVREMLEMGVVIEKKVVEEPVAKVEAVEFTPDFKPTE